MKTLRFALVALVAVASASASFAGPGLQYWKSRSAVRAPAAPAAAAKKAEPCTTMKTPNGKVTVKCEGAVMQSAECKQKCVG